MSIDHRRATALDRRLGNLTNTAMATQNLVRSAIHAIALYAPDGMPGGAPSDTERVTGGTRSDPTGGAVITRVGLLDGFDDDYDEHSRRGLRAIETNLDVIEAAFKEIYEECTTMVRPLIPPAEAPAAGEGDCMCCERFVAGTEADRLREGFCDACRQAWRRYGAKWIGAGGPDRTSFIAMRRAQLAER